MTGQGRVSLPDEVPHLYQRWCSHTYSWLKNAEGWPG